MTHKISILVRADIGHDTIDLIVSGCLNQATADTLALHVARARTCDPAAPVVVDLADAHHVDLKALERLRTAVGSAHVRGYVGRLAEVEFLLPQTILACVPTDTPQAMAT